MNPSFWRGKRVLVTGHTGFKGSWLSLWLQYMGADVAGYALPPDAADSLFQEAAVDSNMASIMGDIRDFDLLSQTVARHNPEIVFHLAAQPIVRTSYQMPVETFDINTMGTVHVLQALRHACSIRSIVVVTTDKCYENREWCWSYREDDALGGRDPYSASKACAEIVTSSFRRSFFLDRVGIATARAGNVFGGGDWAPNRIIPDAIRAFAKNRPLVVRNPTAIRPWQHVLEPLAGYLLLAEQLFLHCTEFSGAWNFGPREEDAVTVGALADLKTHSWGGGTWHSSPNVPDLHESMLLRLDSSRATQLLRWRPCWSLPYAIQQTTKWYRAHEQGATLREFTIEQISQYIRQANEQQHHHTGMPKLWQRSA